METGHFILEILLLILVIAIGFSYSEEVSSNRTLRAQLKKPSSEAYWLKIRIGDMGQRLAEQEAEIVCKDEEIKSLNETITILKPEQTRSPRSFNALYRGEWVHDPEPEEINEQGTHVEPSKVCDTCGGRGKYRKAYDRHLSDCDVCEEKGELAKSMDRYLRAINVLKSVRHNLRVGGQNEKTTAELSERVKSCIAEYNKTKPKDWN